MVSLREGFGQDYGVGPLFVQAPRPKLTGDIVSNGPDGHARFQLELVRSSTMRPVPCARNTTNGNKEPSMKKRIMFILCGVVAPVASRGDGSERPDLRDLHHRGAVANGQ